MNEQADQFANDADGWPLPSVDVLRELDPPAVVWPQFEDAAATPQTRRSARG